MAESVVSVCWKEHTNELAMAFKSLLENNFLVDCTLSAEGQNLKAHRLVLSASSPYFHELFSEEIGKHPFVILLDASFETLKAVIDFVYRGEAQIPECNLKPFLALAHSLQIKGLRYFTQDYENENLCSNTTENVPQDPSVKNQVTCEVQGINVSQEDSRKNNSRGASLPSTGQQATQQRSGSQEGKTLLSQTDLQLPEGQGEEPIPSTTGHKALASSGNLTSRSPTKDRPFICDICGASFTMPSSLVIHNRSHTRDQPFICDVCGASFTVPSSLLIHIRSHKRNRLFVCDVCGAPFTERCNFFAHKRTHTGERPFSCGGSDASLTKRSQLVSHSRSHTGERPFSCGVCGAFFTRRQHLVYHSRTHAGERPHSCDVCGKAFVLAHHLSRHKRLHTGDRPYSCEFCDKTFIEKYELRLHKCIHTGERPHLCQFCGKGFIQKHELNSHLRTHAGE